MITDVDKLRTKLNSLTVKAERAGYTPRTQIVAVQEVAPSLVVPNNLAGAGKIYSRSEINQMRLNKFGQNAELLTEEQYNNMFANLYEAIGDFTTLNEYRRDFYARAADVFSDMNGHLASIGENNVDIFAYTIGKTAMRALFYEAKRKQGDGKNTYTHFYESLANEINYARQENVGWEKIIAEAVENGFDIKEN